MSFLDSAPRLARPVSVSLPGFFSRAVAPGPASDAGGVPRLRLFIGGEWRDASAGATFDVTSPIDGTVIARAPKADRDDVGAAIDAARETRAGFRAQPAAERLELCEHAAGILADHLDTF